MNRISLAWYKKFRSEWVPARVAKQRAAGLITHVFWLRNGLQVLVDLPADFLPEEADRLRKFILTLPFEDE